MGRARREGGPELGVPVDGYQALPQMDHLYTQGEPRTAERVARRRAAVTSAVRAILAEATPGADPTPSS